MTVVEAQPPLTDQLSRPVKLAYRSLKFLARARVWDRDELPRLFNRMGLDGRGVEVGVQRGFYSAVILSRWRGRELVSVDPWRATDAGYADPANVTQDEHDACYEEACRRLEPFGIRSTIWRETGDSAARFIAHRSLDFVYLDARHDYASVLHDLEVWAPKVRRGGLMCGHDYLDALVTWDGQERGSFEVKSAVDQFFGSVETTIFDQPWVSWWTEMR